MSKATVSFLVMFALFFVAGCDGRALFAGNIALATVPCVLLWLTVNLQKAK